MEQFSTIMKLLQKLRFPYRKQISDDIENVSEINLLGNLAIRKAKSDSEERRVEIMGYREETENFDNLDDEESAPEEKETEIANKLRECCNEFDEEKQEMLQQSAEHLLELGKLYKDHAINGKGKQQKLNFVKSAALINGAMVRYQKLGLKHGRNASKNELQKLHLEILKIDCVKGDKNVDFLQFSDKIKTAVEAYRKDVYEKLDVIIKKRRAFSKEEQKEMANSNQIEEICELSTEHYLDIMRMVGNKCEAIMGKSPCEFSFIGFGSLARKEATLYSEFKHGIILENDVKDVPAIKEYFRWFTTIFHIIITGFGETPIPSVNVRSLNDHYSSNKSRNWFSDSYTPHGVTFDGMMPHAGKVSFDQQQATDYRTRTVELIQSARKMVYLMTEEEDLRNGYSLRETLRATCLVYGNQEVYDRSHRVLDQQNMSEIAKQQSQLLLCPRFVMQYPWLFHYIQEKLTSFLSAMPTLWEFNRQSSYEIVDQMKVDRLINDKTHQKLRNALDVVMEVTMKCAHIRCCQSKNQLHVDTINIIEEKILMDCFVTVISLTVELQRQLEKASNRPEPTFAHLLGDSHLWLMEESTTLSAPAFEVVIKEVEFGLGLACRTINNFVMTADPELASSEAGVAIKFASLIWTTYFDQIFFKLMEGRIELFPNLLKLSSITSTLENLESQCQTLLKFTKGNDTELLLHYYPIIFLSHCFQNQFLQALEEYDRWQELLLEQKVKGMDLPSINVSIELLHIHIMSEALDENDMITRIQQMISTESDYQRKCFLGIGLCLAKLKTDSTKEARKDLCVMVRKIKKDQTKLEKEVQEMLFKNIFDIQLAENFLVDAEHTLHEEISCKQIPNMLVNPLLDIHPADHGFNIAVQQELQSMYEDSRFSLLFLLEEYQPHMLQCNDSADPLECGFSLALALSLFNQRKCASLLWKILHYPTVTEFLMEESVTWILSILSLRCASGNDSNFIASMQDSVIRRKAFTELGKKTLANISRIKRREPSQAMTTPSPINSSNKEIPATSPLQGAEEKISNQAVKPSLRKSLSLAIPEPTISTIHSSSSDIQDLETTKPIIASESKSVLISKEGGKIEIGGCAVSFPPGSFDDVTEVYAKAEIDSSKWPPKYICITAMLWVKSQRKLLSRASVSMKSWCMKNCCDSRKILVDVLHQKIGSSNWDVITSLPLNDLKIFHFDCTDFSPYILGVHEDELPATDLVIEGRLYASKKNNLSLAFFLQHDLNKKEVKEMMAERQCEFQLNYNPLPVKTNDKISTNLNCMDNNFHFPKEFKENFKIDHDFVRLKKKAFFHSPLIGRTEEPQYVLLECTVQKNEVLEDGPHFFNYEWWPLKSALPSQPPPGNHFSVQPGATLHLDQSISGVVTANTMATGGAQVQTTRHDGNERVAVGNEVLSSLSDATKKK